MATYTVELTRRARKQYQERDKPVRRRVDLVLDELAQDPTAADVKAPKAENGLLRAPVGDWRLIDRIDHGKVLVLVVEIGHRNQIYRRMH